MKTLKTIAGAILLIVLFLISSTLPSSLSEKTSESAFNLGFILGNVFTILLISMAIYFLLRSKTANIKIDSIETNDKLQKPNKTDQTEFEMKIKTARVRKGYFKLTGEEPTKKDLDELTMEEIAKCYEAGK